MRWLSLIVMALVTTGLIVLLDMQQGELPPLGRLLSPSHGFWQNAETDPALDTNELNLAGLTEPVRIWMDERGVPHIYAQNDHDLYYAQGYITARMRLFQMEMQTRAAAGRLSEVLGAGSKGRYIEMDRYQRRIGMLEAAKRTVEAMKTGTSHDAIQAYSEGVNAWIAQLSPNEYPLEFKILDFVPEAWTPLKTALLLKMMSYDLAGHSYDLQMSYALARHGKRVVDDLFPNHPLLADPIIPSGTPWVLDSTRCPNQPHNQFIADTLALASLLDYIKQPMLADIYGQPRSTHMEPSAIGSNNWAIAGSRSATGKPILANDPHLRLQLPSLWFEIQLSTPDHSVYGVSLPGSPCVIIGFNQKVAWGVTNVDADVLDWYHIRYRDKSQTEYLHDGQWLPIRTVVEEIQVRGGRTILDTVRYTRHGPVAYEEGRKYPEVLTKMKRVVPQGFAMRWLAHDPSDELRTFYQLNRANGYNDYVKALSTYICPAQNFAYADADGNIALWVNGKFPLKWKEQGKFLLDGSAPAHDWQGWVPHASNPHVRNPERGFVSSANQASTDTTYPFWLNWRFETWERGVRINQVLAKMQHGTADSLHALQNDDYNLLAERVLNTMLRGIANAELNERQSEVVATLKAWNKHNSAEAIAPSVFTLWWKKLGEAIWEDDFGGGRMLYPSTERTALLITRDSSSHWYDDKRTTSRETLKGLLSSTFKETVDSLGRYAPYGPKWAWAQYRNTRARHMLQQNALSSDVLNAGGSKGVLNATTETTGPSWRMVVELGATPKAYVTYPGGQTGNPGSPQYMQFIEHWRRGELYRANWWPTEATLPKAGNTREGRYLLHLTPAQ
jgi:penicillin G amidase